MWVVKLTRLIFYLKIIRVEFVRSNTCNQFSCDKCQFFQPDGRYQGSCNKINITVKGEWEACHLALRAFSSFEQPIRMRIDLTSYTNT